MQFFSFHVWNPAADFHIQNHIAPWWLQRNDLQVDDGPNNVTHRNIKLCIAVITTGMYNINKIKAMEFKGLFHFPFSKKILRLFLNRFF